MRRITESIDEKVLRTRPDDEENGVRIKSMYDGED